MNSGQLVLTIVIAALFLAALRWSHRCWGKAILSALFAPLVALPLAVVAFLASTFLLGMINGLLSALGPGLSDEVVKTVAVCVSGSLIAYLAYLYCREQRSLSLVETGPRFGPRHDAPLPKINQKGPLV